MDIRSLATVARFLGIKRPESAVSGDVIAEIRRREEALRDGTVAAQNRAADRLETGAQGERNLAVEVARLERELAASENALARVRADRDNLDLEVAELRRAARPTVGGL